MKEITIKDKIEYMEYLIKKYPDKIFLKDILKNYNDLQAGKNEMPDDIIMIDNNRRKRKIDGEWKLEKKDPITGVWVIHPAQFFADNKDEMMKMFKEIDEDNERERQDMFKKERAEDFIKYALKYEVEENEPIPDFKVAKVINVKNSSNFKSNEMEIIFDGIFEGKSGRYLAGCSSYSGDFYEPPNEECWFNDIKELIASYEETVKTHTTPKNRFLDPEKTKKNLVSDSAFSPIKTKKQYDMEKNRSENIYKKDIERLKYLKQYQPTWKWD